MSDEITFRDFAMASADSDPSKAQELLASLLGVAPFVAAASTAHFQAQMATGPEFMMKAMSMRGVVSSKDHAALCKLLDECFALGPEAASSAATVVLARYA